ncbi:MAG: SRPBCC domain-containing protein [Vulcanimicrobiaceae bacterium]
MNQDVRNIYEVYIRTTPERLWDAITNGELTRQYFFGGILEPRPQSVGDKMSYRDELGALLTDGEVLEIDPPHKLVQTWMKMWDQTKDPDPRQRSPG